MERTITVLTETDIVALFTVMSQRNYNSSVPVSLGHPFEISCGSHGRAGRQRRSVQRHSWVWAGHISKSGRLAVSAFIGNPVTRAGKRFSRLIHTLTPTHSLRRHMWSKSQGRQGSGNTCLGFPRPVTLRWMQSVQAKAIVSLASQINKRRALAIKDVSCSWVRSCCLG